MTRRAREEYYEVLSDQATTDESGGLAKERSVLLLWFLRNVVGIDDIDAYDYVCDGDNDKGIDGLFLEPPSSDDEVETLVIYQSKYTESVTGSVGDSDIDRLMGTAAHFSDAATLHRLLEARLEPSLRRLIDQLGVVTKLEKDPASLKVRLVILTSGTLHADAARKVANLKDTYGDSYIDVWTIDRLGPMAEAVRSPDRLQETIEITIDDRSLAVAGSAPNRVAITPVAASAIASWPGIQDRWLFALNVRHQLRANKVSRGLDRAIENDADHRDFLAYHNGITLVCDSFAISDDCMTVENPSVVNGAQSVLAFRRGQDAGHLTDELTVAVKVVEVAGRPLLAKEVSRRSNTQSGVNPRNLMANSGPQLRLARDFSSNYEGIVYETRPDTISPSADRVIKNDDAAQLLCAIYNAWPWLAVKKLSLFESPSHSYIFSESITAHHIVLADAIRSAVQKQREHFPDGYRSSWRLTALIACYLVGQIAREDAAEGVSVLDDPGTALADPEITAKLENWAYIAAAAMAERHDELNESDESDDFKKDFKNEKKLRGLGARARRAYKMAQRMRQ